MFNVSHESKNISEKWLYEVIAKSSFVILDGY